MNLFFFSFFSIIYPQKKGKLFFFCFNNEHAMTTIHKKNTTPSSDRLPLCTQPFVEGLLGLVGKFFDYMSILALVSTCKAEDNGRRFLLSNHTTMLLKETTPLEQSVLSSYTTSVTFGHDFNQSIDDVNWPELLKSITFVYSFNKPIVKVNWPKSLKSITFCWCFNQPVNEVDWPQSLESISFHNNFDQPISGAKWPPYLKSITFGDDFNRPINKVKWPQSLERIFLAGNSINRSTTSPGHNR